MVEVARLESVYRFIAYPGFESPSLRQEHKQKSHPRVAFLFVSWRREEEPLRALRPHARPLQEKVGKILFSRQSV